VRRSAGGDVRVQFVRNALDELLQVTDPAGNISRVTYDMLGRTLSTQHPDARLTTMTCDAAGNLLKKVTAELAQTLGDGGSITYTYEYERPFEVIYPRNIHNRVTYAWGAPGATNGRAGWLVLMQDASGGQDFSTMRWAMSARPYAA
jgi:YD repeat-containing protein